jgi:hypothetical protein
VAFGALVGPFEDCLSAVPRYVSALDATRCDDGVVPLICPTCQMVSQDASGCAGSRLLCMGLFSMFLLFGHGSLGPDLISSGVGG